MCILETSNDKMKDKESLLTLPLPQVTIVDDSDV